MKRIYLLILAMFVGISGIFAQNFVPKDDWVIVEVDDEGAQPAANTISNNMPYSPKMKYKAYVVSL